MTSDRPSSVSRKLPPVDDWIEIPRELTMHNEFLDLCIDLAFINNVVALTGVDKQVKYRHYIPLPNRTKKALFNGKPRNLRQAILLGNQPGNLAHL